jgi:hypothetical protein
MRLVLPDVINGHCFKSIKTFYVGQPDDHIGRATLMPFTSIHPTESRTNPFQKKIFRIGREKNSVILSQPF